MLAWLGGLAVLAGLAFLLTIAISRGWLGEGARTAARGALSLGLLGAGVWLREHRDRTEAALAAAAVGVAGRSARSWSPARSTSSCRRARAARRVRPGARRDRPSRSLARQVMGWLGLLGALLAPAALGALDGAGIGFLAIAYAATSPCSCGSAGRCSPCFAFASRRCSGSRGCARHAGRRRPARRSSSSAR